MINNVTFNSVDFWEDLGAALSAPPEYPIPAEIKEQVHIKGANGSYTEATGYYEDLKIALSFKALLNQDTRYKDNFTEFKRRLFKICNIIHDPKLSFKDNPDRYYKVKSLEVGAVAKVSEWEAEFDISFICDPFLYNPKEEPVTTTGDIMYSGDIPNAPVILYKASAGSNSIQCNGRTLSFNSVGGNVAINRNPYSVVTVDNVPVVTQGEAPLFRPGTNTITISAPGYASLTIIKNERYLG